MTRVFITGISGQDGSYLADRLVAEGAEVHGLIRGWDDDARALHERHPGIDLHEGDLSDATGLADLVRGLAPSEIYNLAGISSVAQSWREPVLTGQITGVAVTALLDAASRLPGEVRVFQASSSEIFGDPEHAPQDESTPIAPNSPYGVAKAYAHRMAALFRARGLFVATGILYNHESPRRPEAFVTRKITAAAARISLGLQETLELGDLTVERDWGWAPDYVDAMLRATRHDVPGDFVIATGKSHTVADFVAAAFRAAGVADGADRVRVNPEFIRPAEISRMRGDAGRARAELGWAPSVDFDGLVSRMVEHDLSLIREGAGSAG
ncbi:GDP-mannose 4,6-dehydratase [Protaetiibacter larvae]|uniref:GDP-mannose 4,6-dehydratase n=1 Tax=Protaetiibacter larvae TaxID=2592654 RepID=A0A5C1Y4F3_9MICO|nr:GDP-mannose 4,6-dehydratase [Protaetiibacter larvae]QEO08631.1 GDP-mannose 4,6-dehydratase [Protaetiibacter larvae]